MEIVFATEDRFDANKRGGILSLSPNATSPDGSLFIDEIEDQGNSMTVSMTAQRNLLKQFSDSIPVQVCHVLINCPYEYLTLVKNWL